MDLPAHKNLSPAITPDQIRAQLERILTSKHFRQTRSLDKFLQFIVEHTVTGDACELKESLLGRAVFHRGNDFDPSKDSVVRVQAGVLRKKLASYYAEEGQADEIIIDLPKGCYVPTFLLRTEVAAAPADSLALVPAEALAEQSLSGPIASPLPLFTTAPARRWQPGLGQLAAAFVVGIVSTLALLQSFGKERMDPSRFTSPAAVAVQAQHLLWEKFFEPGAQTVLAYGTPQFFQTNGFYVRDVLVNSPQEGQLAVGARLASVRKALNAPLDPIEVYTGVGEAHGIHMLTRFFGQRAQELNIARSRLVGWQEVKNANLIFLSSMRFHTLAEQLNYPNDFVIKTNGVTGTILNLHPAAGEQAEYGVSGGESYAVITLWPGKAEQRRILQLSGNTTWGTLAAADYATDKESLRKLHEVLEQCRQQHGWERHPPYFQVLVRAEVKDAQPIALAFVTHHDLEVPSVGGEAAARVALK
jgi:hypothetical protein